MKYILIVLALSMMACEKQELSAQQEYVCDYDYPVNVRFTYIKKDVQRIDSIAVYNYIIVTRVESNNRTIDPVQAGDTLRKYITYRSANCGAYGGGNCVEYYNTGGWYQTTISKWEAPECGSLWNDRNTCKTVNDAEKQALIKEQS